MTPGTIGTTKNSPARWTAEEVAILRKHYNEKSVPELATLLPGRTEAAIYIKALKMGMKRSEKAYTKEELDIIQSNLNCSGLKELSSLLPGRTYASVRSKVHSMGLTTGNRVRWTEEEDEILRENEGQSWKCLAALLGGRRTIDAIRNRVYMLRTKRERLSRLRAMGAGQK